jgi:uncharacterized membrane protein YsdA (DUF1294 family)
MLTLGAYLLTINGAAALMFWIDKAAARAGRRRIPERRLLQVALFGGSLGAVAAQQALRHKTAKPSFAVQLWLILGLQLGAGIGLALTGGLNVGESFP